MATKGSKLKITPFDPHGDRLNLGKRWERWLERFERDLKYNGCDPSDKENSETAQMALLIYAGPQVEDIHDSLPSPTKPASVNTTDWTDYRQSKTKLNQYFLPQKSNDFALFELMRVKPEVGERTGNYVARLRKAAEKCDFKDWSADKMIKCLIISNLQDDQLRLICLQKELTLDQVLEKAQKREDAMTMNAVMHKKDGDSEKVNKVKQRNTFKGTRSRREDTQERDKGKHETKGKDDEQCLRCGNRRHKTRGSDQP